jgi:hypothetical protein
VPLSVCVSACICISLGELQNAPYNTDDVNTQGHRKASVFMRPNHNHYSTGGGENGLNEICMFTFPERAGTI